MANLQCVFYSKALEMDTCVNVILPNTGDLSKTRVVFLLHGLTDNYSAWCRYSMVERYALAANVAVVMPEVQRSFYCDTVSGMAYFQYISRELPELCSHFFHLPTDPALSYIMGLSMGGFGACRNALKYCETFGKAAILSGALHIYEYPVDWVETQGNIIGEVRNFGNLEETRQSDRNPRYLMDMIKNDPDKRFPAFYVACGLQDVLLEANRSIARALTDVGADVTYEEGEGIHDWNFWNTYIQHVLKWLDYAVPEKAL